MSYICGCPLSQYPPTLQRICIPCDFSGVPEFDYDGFPLQYEEHRQVVHNATLHRLYREISVSRQGV